MAHARRASYALPPMCAVGARKPRFIAQMLRSPITNRGAAEATARVSAWLAILLGSLVLLGWWSSTPILTSFVPGYVTMKPNTAMALVLGGIALWCAVVITAPPFVSRPGLVDQSRPRPCDGRGRDVDEVGRTGLRVSRHASGGADIGVQRVT